MTLNPFYNPFFLFRVLKSYLVDINNLRRFNDDQLRHYRDKKFRKIIRYAFTVPMYKNLYDEAGIRIEDINGLEDINKLPIIYKEDIEKYYPIEDTLRLRILRWWKKWMVQKYEEQC